MFSTNTGAQGKMKHWGVSVNTLPECELAVSGGRAEAMQMEYNILEQEPAEVFAKARPRAWASSLAYPLSAASYPGASKRRICLPRRTCAAES